ncbi:hypothetical protein N0V90_005540 [Kalmusia sp. IMI 367209]|nr:hypothetical protein N0V90_005540 [Kalmusia sp. IMI 367209]
MPSLQHAEKVVHCYTPTSSQFASDAPLRRHISQIPARQVPGQPRLYRPTGLSQQSNLNEIRTGSKSSLRPSEETRKSQPSTNDSLVALVNGTSNKDDSVVCNPDETDDARSFLHFEVDEDNRTSTIHPKGNLILIVGNESTQRRKRNIIVQSDTVEQFSPRWKDLVARSTREGVLSRRRRLLLQDDDADMMLVLMQLSHAWHLDKVPRELSFRQLLAVACICERYDMNVQVSPWLRSWIVPHQRNILTPRREQWLSIAYQFGLEGHYVKLARHLAQNCRIDKDGCLYVPGTQEKLVGHFPEDTIAQIRRTRIKTLASFFSIVYSVVSTMENNNICQAELPRSPYADVNIALGAEHTMCTHSNHGEIIRYLKMYGYWPPITQAGTVTKSVNEVFEHLTTIPAIRFRSTYHTCLKDIEAAADRGTAPSEFLCSMHSKCDMGKVLGAKITDAWEKMEHPVTQETVDQIRANATKSGLEAHGFEYLAPEPSVDSPVC